MVSINMPPITIVSIYINLYTELSGLLVLAYLGVIRVTPRVVSRVIGVILVVLF